jgi:hypothetical protein
MTRQKKTRSTTAKRTTATAAASAAAPKAPARPRVRRRGRVGAPDHATIAERAYFIGLAGGADPVTNWLQAERELAAAA